MSSYWDSEEHRQKAGSLAKARWQDPEIAPRMKAGQEKSLPLALASAHANASKRSLALWADPEWKAEQAARIKAGRWKVLATECRACGTELTESNCPQRFRDSNGTICKSCVRIQRHARRGTPHREISDSVQRSSVCSICGEPGRLVIDHDHKTGAFRGLPCTRCNTGLGHFDDNPELLERAAVYLELGGFSFAKKEP